MDYIVTRENQAEMDKLFATLVKARDILVCEGATLTAPALTEAWSISVHEGATLTAPLLKRK